MRWMLAFCTVVTLAVLAMSTRVTGQLSNGVLVSLDTQPDVVLGEPIVIHLTIQNRSTEQIQTDLGYDRKGNLRIAVTRPDGVVVEPSPPTSGVGGGISRIPIVVVPRGSVFSQRLILDEWMRLDTPGAYLVRVDI